MSTTMYMACHTCKKAIAAARHCVDGTHLFLHYYEMARGVKVMGDFLFAHQDHALGYVRDEFLWNRKEYEMRWVDGTIEDDGSDEYEPPTATGGSR